MPIDPYLVNRAAQTFPLHVPDTLTQSRPGLRAKSVAHAAFKAAQQHLTNISTAARYEHPEVAPDVTPELRAGVTANLRSRVVDAFESPLGLIRQAERALEEANKAAEPHRLKLNPESTSQLIRTDQAWNNHIKPMLDAGKGWDEIIPTLDADGVLAAQRFAPAHESNARDRFHQHEVPAVVDGIRAMAERRAVDIAPPEAREILREAQDVAAVVEYTRNMARWTAEADYRNATSYTIGITRSAFQVGAQNPVDTSLDAQEAYATSLAS
ncbi:MULTISPECIES: hypothetical protein [unclassified Microbacterium]|uniref:hypothetical protein n=1 Tax=unclassified Microbacterium TaxID=2609290 RepID=UPI000C2B9DF1|nr:MULTISPECIES: hypothetical protein [unclassified Microbacterium]